MIAETIDPAKIDHILHVLRNPYGWDGHVLRDARLAAAAMLEQLGAELVAVKQERDEAWKELARVYSWGLE